MDQEVKSESEISKQVEKIHTEIQPALYEHNPKSTEVFEQYEKTTQEFTDKILKITEKIKDQYPELSKYLEEMTITIPDEKYPEITIKNLQEYYESLISLLNRYVEEQTDAA